MKLESLRREICLLNQELPRNNLVAWTSGNVSGRDPESGLMVIKPSGVRYEALTPESMVVVDLEGKVVEGEHKPSSDTLAHVYVYRNRPDINGVVHTHSYFCHGVGGGRQAHSAGADGHLLMNLAAPIPVGAYAKIGGDEIGREIVRSIGDSPGDS